MSGTLWALVFDPVVRLLSCRIDYRHTKLSAYADDLAFVLHSIKKGLPLLADALTETGEATRLELNLGKTVVVPLHKTPLQRLRNVIAAIAPHFSEAKLQYVAKYLGIMVGPHGEEEAWVEQIATLRARAVRVKACKLPLNSAIPCYNVYGASTLSHVAQFREPSSELRVAEAGVLATICSAPMNAMPRACLANLRSLGFSSQVATADAMSLAARCRVAMAGSSHAAAIQFLNEALESEDALFAPPRRAIDTSIVKTVERAYYIVHNINSINIDELFRTSPTREA